METHSVHAVFMVNGLISKFLIYCVNLRKHNLSKIARASKWSMDCIYIALL